MSSSDDNLVLAAMMVGALIAGGMFGAGIMTQIGSSSQLPQANSSQDAGPPIQEVETDPNSMLIGVDPDRVRNVTVEYPNGSELLPYSTSGDRHIFSVPEAGTQNVDHNTTFTLTARNDHGMVIERREVEVTYYG